VRAAATATTVDQVPTYDDRNRTSTTVSPAMPATLLTTER